MLSKSKLTEIYNESAKTTHSQWQGPIPSALQAVAEAAVKADREDLHTVSDSELAGRIMTLLGHATDPSLEPGADPLRDRVAALLARSL